MPDGTSLVWLSLPKRPGHPGRQGLLVRLITYTFVDPTNPGQGKTYRLVTTLLDPPQYPAQELAVSYHERWDIEETYDELEIHLMGGRAPLRSRTVPSVLQEIYGLLIAHYDVHHLKKAGPQIKCDTESRP